MSQTDERIHELDGNDREEVIEVLASVRERADAIVRAVRTASPRAFELQVQGASERALSLVGADVAHRWAALGSVVQSPFFCRIKSDRGEFLFSKARFPGILDLDLGDATVVSWTSALFPHLRGARPGEVVAPDGGVSVKHSIQSSSDWERLAPDAGGGVVRLATCDVYIESSDALAGEDGMRVLGRGESIGASQAALSPEPREYGLREIITLADASQRTAMHMAFRRDVVIEGPPGSGKTSVGLMRIPCLIDGQWDEFRLNPAIDPPVYTEDTVRVFVSNPEMIPYLERLARDIDIRRVPIETFAEFCSEMCVAPRQVRVLHGRRVRESQALRDAKLSPDGVDSFLAAFRSNCERVFEESFEQLKRDLDALRQTVVWSESIETANEATRLRSALEDWRLQVQRLTLDALTSGRQASVSALLNREIESAHRDIESRLRESVEARGRDFAQRRREALSKIVARISSFLNRVFDRKAILEHLELRDKLRPIEIERWQRQAERTDGRPPECADSDYVLHALLASVTLFGSRDGVSALPSLGFGADWNRFKLSHAVVDEAQDLSIAHAILLRGVLGSAGALTLVGDLRQRLDGQGAFSDWSELPLLNPARAVFAVNHRQTRELGSYLKDLHAELFGVPANWSPSDRHGPCVRERLVGPRELTHAIAAEAAHWSRTYPAGNVAILLVDSLIESALEEVRDRIEDGLQDSLVAVDVAAPDRSELQLRRETGVIIAPVAMTRGLEFDSVVVVMPSRVVPGTQANRLYVGCSRARVGLSVIRANAEADTGCADRTDLTP